MSRRFCSALCLALTVAFAPMGNADAKPARKVAVKSAPLPKKPAPQGMLELPSGGSGRILTSRMSGTASARKMLMALRIGVNGYFDSHPVVSAAFADQADQNLQAAFTARLKNIPLRGVIAIQRQGLSAQATMIFDRAAAFRSSFPRLLARVNGTPAKGGSGAAKPVKLTMTPLLDGSGQIGLPSGWRVTGSYKGTVDAAGPDGAVLGLGGYAAVVSRQTGGMFPSSPMVDFNDPVRAALDYGEFQTMQARRQGLPETRVTQVIDTRPVQMTGPAAFIRYSVIVSGKPYEALGLFSIMPVDQTQGILYFSLAMAPKAVFKKDLPAMWAAWQSWGIKNSVFTERLTSAVQSMRETGEILSRMNRSTQEAYAHVNKAWDQYIRDESTWKNPETGTRYTFQPHSALPSAAEIGPLVPVPISDL